MKAIRTIYLGPTNTRPTRYKAFDMDGNMVVIPADNVGPFENNHKRACLALLEKMQWKGPMVGGWLKDGMVWVFTSTDQEHERID